MKLQGVRKYPVISTPESVKVSMREESEQVQISMPVFLSVKTRKQTA